MDKGFTAKVHQTLADAYPKEQARLRGLLKEYNQLGTAGASGAMTIEETLRQADKAAAEQDVVAMIRCYERMKGHS